MALRIYGVYDDNAAYSENFVQIIVSDQAKTRSKNLKTTIMAYSIDKLPNENYIIEFASQYNSIPVGFIQQCDDSYSGNNSKDVLYGLIVGFANARNMVKQVDPNAKSINSLGMIICYLAKKYLDL